MNSIGGKNRFASSLRIAALATVWPAIGLAQESPAPQNPPENPPAEEQSSPPSQAGGFNLQTFSATNNDADMLLPNVGGTHGMELIRLRAGTTRIPLRRAHIIPHSERLDLDGKILTPGTDYSIDHESGLVVLNVGVTGGSMRASYRYDATKPQTGTVGNGEGTQGSFISLLPGASFAVGLGVTERTADGRMLTSDIYGLSNSFSSGAMSLRGGFFVGQRSGTDSMDLMTGESNTQQGADEGTGQAIIQQASMRVGGGTISVDYRDIDRRFTGMDTLRGAGFTAEEVNQFAKERGLKRSNFQMRGVQLGDLGVGSGFRTVGDDNGSIDWRDISLSYQGLTVNFASQVVDQGFNRFKDIAEEDRGQLEKERGLERTTFNANANTSIGQFQLSQLGVNTQGGSGLHRRAFQFTRNGLEIGWTDQHVEQGFTRFGDLREADRKQLEKEQGIRRETFNLAFNGPVRVTYNARAIRSDAGRFNSDAFDMAAGPFSVTHRRLDADETFNRLDAMSGEEVAGYVNDVMTMMGPDVKPNNNDPRFFLNGAGLTRDFWSGNYQMTKDGAIRVGWFNARNESGGVSVRNVDINMPGVNLSIRDQNTDDAFDGANALTNTEQRILGTDAGLNRTNVQLNMNLSGRSLEFTSLQADDINGRLRRQFFNYKDKDLSILYRQRGVDSEFRAFGSLNDGERDLLSGLRGKDQTELNIKWALSRRIGLEYSSLQGIQDDGVTQFGTENLQANITVDNLTKFGLQLWNNGRFDPTASFIDQTYRRMQLERNLGNMGNLMVMREERSFDGEEDTTPDGVRDTIVYSTNITPTTSVRTEHSRTDFEDGTRETLTSNTVETQITPRAGVSVTDSRLLRDGDAKDEVNRNYGFWFDFGGGIRLDWGTQRAMNGGDGTRNGNVTMSGGQFAGIKVDSAQYQHQNWDGQRDRSVGNVSISNSRPLDWGFLDDVRFHFTADTLHDKSLWQKENRGMGFGATIGSFRFGFDYRSQIDSLQQRAIDRVFSVSTDTEGDAPVRADIIYDVRTMPNNEQVMVRNFRFVAGAGQTWTLNHEVQTNPLKDDNRALLGSVATEWRTNRWSLGYNGFHDAKLALAFDEKINDKTNQLIRGAGIDLTMFANSGSPLKLEYRLNQEETNGNRRTRHWFALAFNQQPGPNQTFGISVTNLNWEHMRPSNTLANQWGFRMDYSIRF
ncbi:MAG: hypothetical protein KF812_02090 [Fimbriimonadaceae bacterium]|nr:hypothetical protein [Fimbriimonadaceae bacterium]